MSDVSVLMLRGIVWTLGVVYELDNYRNIGLIYL